MARPTPFARLFDARRAALLTALPLARRGDVTGVHQARVASRRLREVLPVVEALSPSVGPAADAVRRVTRALGPIRELDVAVALYTSLVASTPVPSLAHQAMTSALTTARARATRAARKVLTVAASTTLAARLEAVTRETVGVTSRRVAASVEARVQARAGRLARAMARTGTTYVPSRLHDVRIAVKQLRYALEIAVALGPDRTASTLQLLQVVQEELGRAHDLHVVAEHVRRVEARLLTRSRAAARGLGTLAAGIDAECRRLHARFLTRRSALTALVERLPTVRPGSPRRTAA